MMEKIKKAFKVKILETFYDGFRGRTVDGQRVFGVNTIRDNIALKEHDFEKEEVVTIILELVEKVGKDVVENGKIEFCIAVFQTATNGIYTKSYKEGEDPKRSKLFYESRGMITGPMLERNPFEMGDLIKVKVRR